MPNRLIPTAGLSARLTATIALAVVCAAAPLTLRAASSASNPSAAQILSHAESQARAQHKNILLDFDASWCVNCRLYDRLLSTPSINAILGSHFVFISMDTGENPHDKKHADTPGAVAFENSIGGKNAGWPYIVILSPTGHPIVDSFRPDPSSKTGRANIGYPVLPQEIDWFMTMLHRGAPSISHADQARVHAWLTTQAAPLLH